MEITSKLQYTHVYIYIYTYMLKLLLAIRVYCQGAQDFQWPYLNPFALVSYLCVACVHYAGLLKYHLANDTSSIIIYWDEVRPGNPLRPGVGREVFAFYWIFSDLPQHLMSNTSAWLPLGFLRSSAVNKAKGGLSGIMSLLIRAFFSTVPGENNFAEGCCCTYQGESFMIRANFAGFLGDEKFLNYTFSTKGANFDVGNILLYICLHRLYMNILLYILLYISPCSFPPPPSSSF
jgi:hypothetical protein